MRRAALLALLLAAIAACGKTTVVREPTVTVGGSPAPDTGDRPVIGSDAVRIAVVTHGQASSPFWAIVRNGVDAARRQMDVIVNYRAPDVYSLARMKALIEQAIESRPDGLVVSLPEPGVYDAVRRATRAGIPTVSINSGSDAYKSLGVLAHVGQPEDRAGLEAGRRLADAGVRRALCVNQQVGNIGLDDRCRGLEKAMRAVGGTAKVLPVDDESPSAAKAIAAAAAAYRADGLLALNSTSAIEAVQGIRAAHRADRVQIGAFDLGPDVLRALRAGRLLFAVDQQAYLQGYLPIVLLTQKIRYGLFPAQGDVIPTGPNFVTQDDAGRVLDLSRRSIR